MSDNETKRLLVIPLRNMVLFPGVVQPIDVGRPKSLVVAERAAAEPGLHIAVLTQSTPEIEDPAEKDVYPIAVEAEVLRVMKIASNRATVVVRGLRRIRLTKLEETEETVYGDFEVVEETGEAEVESQGLAMAVRDSAKQLITISPDIPDESAALLDQLREPGKMADVAAANLDGSIADKVELLELTNIPDRLREVLTRLQRALETYRVKEHIDSHVRAEMGKHQREAVLRQRMRAIQEELGDADEDDAAAEFEERLKEADMPKEVEEVAQKQLARLRQIPPQSPEHTVTRTYLEWLVELPWHKETPDDLDLERARTILDEDHYGLEKVKKRIIEYLAVRRLKPDKKGPILCLVGPPGVGKTSLGRSIARATGRNFVRLSLGGVRDEAEIRGHRRTYIGALPGKIAQYLRKAGSNNPVFLLDEVDKMASDFRGDPASALLEVLDPEQNHAFNDHYLDLDYDLSDVMFITTANNLSGIPLPLQDRMEIIELPGYTEQEKLEIARRYLVPKQITANGMADQGVKIADDAVLRVVREYTKEAGVRSLERELASVCRKLARKKVKKPEQKRFRVSAEHLPRYLGVPRFSYGEQQEEDNIGFANGLAVTYYGGDLLVTEVTVMPGKGKLQLTGKLGDVMQESAHAALSYVRSRAASLGLEPDFYQHVDIHVHCPEGAIPKDGPSAGITMATAIVSALIKLPVRRDVAMTGEITLRGRVLAIGGLREKLLAAKRSQIPLVLIPAENEKDLAEIPKAELEGLEVRPLKHMDEVLRRALRLHDQSTLFSQASEPSDWRLAGQTSPSASSH